MRHSSRGSFWHRWDLHFHTPSSFDYEDKSVTNQQIVDRLIQAGVDVLAITDHHTMDIDRIKELQRLGAGKLTILPGIELRDDHGGQPIHYICLFPENCDLEHVWTTLQGSLGLTQADIHQKGGDQRVYVPIKEGAAATKKLGGVISIHAGSKSNSIDGISNREQFQRRIKYDITKHYVNLMEIGQLKDIDTHLNIIFPATGLDKPLVICSDNHSIVDYLVKTPLWFRADPTFRGLLMVLREPRDRVFIGERPLELIRVEQNQTKYVRSISFRRKTEAVASNKWFTGKVDFNPGLVAIVGNKGSGKSALADTLGLLGSTKNSESFSFLNRDRFCHPANGHAAHFESTLEWESGEKVNRCLADTIKPEEVERIKYLPQDYVEKVCNEIVGTGEEGFEKELKSVIFSHVPESQRLGHASLDDLVRFQTDEKQKRIDSLIKQLREINRSRAVLEAQADPTVRREIEAKIVRNKLELESHEKIKPREITNPAVSKETPESDKALIQELTETETLRKSINEEITQWSATLNIAERRQAMARRLLEKLENFQKDFSSFEASLKDDLSELGLTSSELMSLSINKEKPQKLRDAAVAEIKNAQQHLDSITPPGLREQLKGVDKKIEELQSKLDAPNRLYQSYLKAQSVWEARRIAIIGSVSEPESQNGLKAALADLDQLPDRILKLKEEQVELSLQIHAEKVAQAAVYRTLYGSVQKFIDSHVLAKDKLKLEFRAELTNEDFADRLLALLALNRRGTFMGLDDGRARVESFTQATSWEDEQSVLAFLDNIDQALHTDQRDGRGAEVQLKDQLGKGKKPEEIYDLLYGLGYLHPRYVLRWEGKDLSLLSPGERGTLLLVFYLLIDKSDIPLVIDQPEGNLDNHTVAMDLVDCIKEARSRRQVFIITHNPNLAVVCDADQIIHADMDISNGNSITYTSGALENPDMGQYITDVLEGTRIAFDIRGAKYEVSEKN